MEIGLNFAFEEICLVLFTTLAPSGAIALALMSGVSLTSSKDTQLSKRINLSMIVPLLLTMVGLVASTAHLGSPANILYVIMGVGRSPLSNEVFAAVVFLGITGLYIIYCFAEHPKQSIQDILLVAIAVSAPVLIGFVSIAYSVDTIASWNTIWVPVNLVLSSLAGGPLVALATLQIARCPIFEKKTGLVFLAVSAAAAVCCVITSVLQMSELSSILTAVSTVSERAPYFGALVVIFAATSLAGILVDLLQWFHKMPSHAWISAAAAVLALVGIFALRFGFYAIHMTYGLGL